MISANDIIFAVILFSLVVFIMYFSSYIYQKTIIKEVVSLEGKDLKIKDHKQITWLLQGKNRFVEVDIVYQTIYHKPNPRIAFNYGKPNLSKYYIFYEKQKDKNIKRFMLKIPEKIIEHYKGNLPGPKYLQDKYDLKLVIRNLSFFEKIWIKTVWLICA